MNEYRQEKPGYCVSLWFDTIWGDVPLCEPTGDTCGEDRTRSWLFPG